MSDHDPLSASPETSVPSPAVSSALLELPMPVARLLQQIHDAPNGMTFAHEERTRRRHAADLRHAGFVEVDGTGTYRATVSGVRWIDLNGPIDLSDPIPFGQVLLSGDVAASVEEIRQALDAERIAAGSSASQAITFDVVVEALLRKAIAFVNAERPQTLASASAPIRYTIDADGNPALLVWVDVAEIFAPGEKPAVFAVRHHIPLVRLPAGVVSARGGRGRPPTHGLRFDALDALEGRFPFEVAEVRRKFANPSPTASEPPPAPAESSRRRPGPAAEFPATAGVYEIRCNLAHAPGYYVGVTSNLQKGIAQAKYMLKTGVHPCKALWNAWSLHGPDAFSFVVVREIEGGKVRGLREVVIREAMASTRPGLYNPIR